MKKGTMVCVLSAAAAAAFSFSPMKIFYGKYHSKPTELVNTVHIDMDSLSDISLIYDWEAISISQTEGSQLVLQEFMSENNPDYYAKIDRKGASLKIRNGKRPRDHEFNCRVELLIPSSFTGNLAASLDSGSISLHIPQLKLSAIDFKTRNGAIEGDELTGSTVRLNSLNGGISFDTLTADRVSIDLSNGEAEITSLSGNMQFDSGNGSISIEKASGSGTFETSNGSIKLGYTRLEGELYCKTSNGSIDISAPASDIGRYSAKSSNGNVRLQGKKEGNSVSGSLEGTSTVTARTSNGSISIRWI